MKRFLTLTFSGLFALTASAQIGIGTNTPQATLDVNGTLKVGAVANGQPAKGTIRWNDQLNDFEGYNGTAWVSFTKASAGWGAGQPMITEKAGSTVHLTFNLQGTQVGKQLGYSLAHVQGFLIAGAPNDFHSNGSTAGSGSVRIMKRENGTWVQHTALWGPEATPMSGAFGHSLHSSTNQFITGARLATVGNNFAQGKAYIFGINMNGDVSLQATLTAPTGNSSEYFGSAVALSQMHALVGATGYNASGKLNRGIAHIFQRNTYTNTWGHQATLEPPDGLEEDVFGAAVAISGKIAAVASPRAKVGTAFLGGKVYIYRLEGNNWVYSQTLTSPSTSSYDKFGWSMSMANDTLVIGSSQYNGSQSPNKGKVYIYVNSGNTMQLLTTLVAPDGNSGDGFGNSVHFGNGYLVASAPYANVGAIENHGKAYLFRRSGNEWTPVAIMKASNLTDNQSFGHAVLTTPSGQVVSTILAPFRTRPEHGRLYFFEE